MDDFDPTFNDNHLNSLLYNSQNKIRRDPTRHDTIDFQPNYNKNISFSTNISYL